jgi:hypothetical protein
MNIYTAASVFTMLLTSTHGIGSGVSFRRSEFVVMDGHDVPESYHSPLPHTYLSDDDVPDEFTWQNVNGKCYLTHSLNQHIPQCKFDSILSLSQVFQS